jgi:hypothetical protein
VWTGLVEGGGRLVEALVEAIPPLKNGSVFVFSTLLVPSSLLPGATIQMKAIIAILFTCLTLAACAGGGKQSMSWANIREVKIGMTEAELLAIMGPPTLTKSNPNVSSDGVFDRTWVWSNPYAISGARVVSFGLKNGKVTQIPDVPFE